MPFARYDVPVSSSAAWPFDHSSLGRAAAHLRIQTNKNRFTRAVADRLSRRPVVWVGGWVAGWPGGWVRACVRACVHARTHACVCVCVCVRARVCACVCRFTRSAEVEDGYRDVSLALLFTDASGLRIIGEVQVPIVANENIFGRATTNRWSRSKTDLREAGRNRP